MPQKLDSNKNYGQKLISLYARLLFSGERHSLTELATMLRCSKQSVLRLVDDISRSYGVNLEQNMEGNRKYYRVTKPRGMSTPASLTWEEMAVLQMCRDFTAALMGPELFEEASRALMKSRGLLPENVKAPASHFASFSFGTIDYTPHQQTLRTLMQAMEQRKVCKLTYQAGMWDEPKTYYIMPLKIFAHRDTLYVHARFHKAPGKKYRTPKFDPFLPIHRIKQIELTDTIYQYPADYNFTKEFTKDFGVMKGDSFKVAAEFTGWAAQYVAERNWSEDQKIKYLGKGKIRLSFTASSEPELIGWLLSFGEDVKLLKPKWLVKAIADKIKKLQKIYVAISL